MKRTSALLGLVLAGGPFVPAAAQEAPPIEAQEALPAPDAASFRWSGELKLNFRETKDLTTSIFTPFPGAADRGRLVQRTADPGSSFELSTVNLRGEGEIVSGVSAKVEVHLLDLYNRNPTSSDDRIIVREAWLRIGDGPEPSRPGAGKGYVLLGLAPRFSKQLVRRLDSYGLMGTAVGRFEQPQLQVGAAFLRHGYFRASVGNGNPLFMHDTNALAGDNGTPDRVPGSPDRVYETGFPIFYDAKPADVNFPGRFEWGGAIGARFERGESAGVDVMLWRFRRSLADGARIRGTKLLGDLDLLRGEGFPLPFSGRRKAEWGVNLQGTAGKFRLFGQYLEQDLAGLGRYGYEVELAFIHRLPGLFLIKESPFLNWVQPTVRLSFVDNQFDGPREYPALSVLWDWTKWDLGVRAGLLRGLDLTVEYSRQDAILPRRTIHPDEWLVTLRAGF